MSYHRWIRVAVKHSKKFGLYCCERSVKSLLGFVRMSVSALVESAFAACRALSIICLSSSSMSSLPSSSLSSYSPISILISSTVSSTIPSCSMYLFSISTTCLQKFLHMSVVVCVNPSGVSRSISFRLKSLFCLAIICWAQSMDLCNPWIALRKAWICALR